jgi:hypothetical protein
MRFLRHAISSFLFFSPLVLPAASVTRVDEQPDFDALASRAAAAIRDSTKGSSQGATVLLVDFRERSGPVSELGHQFYSVFDAALRKHSQGFIVLNSSDLE